MSMLKERAAHLRDQGLSIAQISRRLRKDRKTVARYLRNVPNGTNGENAYGNSDGEIPQKFRTELLKNSSASMLEDSQDVEIARAFLDGRTGDEIIRSGRDPAAVARVAKTLAALDRYESQRRAPLPELIRRLEALEAEVERQKWETARLTNALATLRSPCPGCGQGLLPRLVCRHCSSTYLATL